MPLLTEQEINKCIGITDNTIGAMKNVLTQIARAVEAKVIEKIKAQGPSVWRFDISEDSYDKKWGFTESQGLAESGDPKAQPLYTLPEGE